jgi:hypothetical protein
LDIQFTRVQKLSSIFISNHLFLFNRLLKIKEEEFNLGARGGAVG